MGCLSRASHHSLDENHAPFAITIKCRHTITHSGSPTSNGSSIPIHRFRWQVMRDLTHADPEAVAGQHSRVATEGGRVAFQNLTNGFRATIRRFRSLAQAGNEYLSERVLDRLVSRELIEFHPLHYFGIFWRRDAHSFSLHAMWDTIGRPACTGSRQCLKFGDCCSRRLSHRAQAVEVDSLIIMEQQVQLWERFFRPQSLKCINRKNAHIWILVGEH